MPKLDAETDHGRVVWAKMSKTSTSYPAIIISTKILDLVLQEKSENVWVFWIGENSFSSLKPHLIYDFDEDFTIHFGKPAIRQLRNISRAVEIALKQYNITPSTKCTLTSNEAYLSWALENLKNLTVKKIGLRDQKKTFCIPADLIQSIKEINSKMMESKVQNNITDEIRNKNGQNTVQNSKQKLKYCFSCRQFMKEKDNSYCHPLFDGTICETCHVKAANVLMPIANDKWNMDCCICFGHDSRKKLILCDFCIRAYCEYCVSIYNSKGSLNQIMKTNPWKCFSCDNTSNINKLLYSHTMEKQLNNLFSIYSGENACHMKKIVKFSKNSEFQIFAFEDVHNNVSTVLKHLKHPFKLFETENLDNFSMNYGIGETITTDKSNHIKLLIQYYPCKENYDQEEFNSGEALQKFLNFILIKDKIELLHPNKCIFWAFETSAAINYKEQQFISRYCGKKPILSTIYTKDIQQRGRFIWSNIIICEKNVASFRKYNIFLKKMKNNDKEDSKPWCFDSVNLILTSLIENHIK